MDQVLRQVFGVGVGVGVRLDELSCMAVGFVASHPEDPLHDRVYICTVVCKTNENKQRIGCTIFLTCDCKQPLELCPRSSVESSRRQSICARMIEAQDISSLIVKYFGRPARSLAARFGCAR